MTVTVVGGTFTILHKGHRLLLEEACRGSDKVIVGLSTDSFSSSRKKYQTVPFSVRESNLRKFFDETGCAAEIRPLTSSEGTAAKDPMFDRIVVSEETLPAALSINAKRIADGMKPLSIDTVPVILAEDRFPIGSARIISGEIDADGTRLTPISVSVASRNGSKIESVARYFTGSGIPADVKSFESYSTEEQPFGEDISAMAIKRSGAAEAGYDYSVGIEAGLIYDRIAECYYDVHVCAVKDRYGNITTGTSSGFAVPPHLIDLVKQGMDLSAAYEKAHGVSQIGKKDGIVSIYSGGELRRKDLIDEAIRNAFVPRLSPYSYGLHFSRKFL